MRALWALVKAELRAFRRDRINLFFSMIFPLIFLLIFGSMFGSAGSRNVSFSLGLIVQAHNPDVDDFIDNWLRKVSVLKLVETGDFEAQKTTLEKGDLSGILVITEDAAAALRNGQPATLQIWTDPSRQTTAQAIAGILRGVTRGYEAFVTGQSPVILLDTKSLADSESNGAQANGLNYMVPGIVAMAIMQSGVFVAIALATRREQLILKRLMATPVTKGTILASQGVFRTIIALLQTTILLTVAVLAFHLRPSIDPLQLVPLILVGSACFLSLGFLVASLVRTNQGALVTAQLINLGMIFLGGVFWPPEIMPAWMRVVSQSLPIYYLSDGLRGALLGFHTHGLALNLGVMAAVAVVGFVISAKALRFEP